MATIELEVLEGLAPFLVAEMRRVHLPEPRPTAREDRLRLTSTAPMLPRLMELRTAVGAYLLEEYPVPRPKALLGDQNLRRLSAQVRAVMELHPAHTFHGLRIDAAGSDSAVLRRLAATLAAETGLAGDPEHGDLLLRIRPQGPVWEVAARLTPRPLSTRAWRVRDVPGALNATIAAAMVEMTRPRRSDRYLNLMCGSGTLLVERLLRERAVSATGVDVSAGALRLARANLLAAGLGEMVSLEERDVLAATAEDAAHDAITADLPYGERTGNHATNAALYSGVLSAAARCAVPGARFAVITHDVRRFEAALAGSDRWETESVTRVFQGGYHPRIWLLARRP